MPTLNLQLNTKLVVCIEQGWNQFTKLDWYYNADGLYQHIHHETIKMPPFPQAYDSFLYSSTTLSVGTVWLMERVNALIDSRMRGIFDVVMGETLKGLLSRQIIESPLDEEKSLHLTLSLGGGMDEWWVYANAVLAMGHLHTREDILNRMWAVNPSIEGWTVVSKGDIYPSLDDDEDTQELPAIVLKDDETVPGEAVYADYKAFKIFIVPRLARMIDMPALVLVSQMENGLVKVIGLDHKNNWYLKTEHKDGTYGGIDTYFNMTELVNALWNAYPKAKWQMRQLGPGGGRFNTVYTQDWNKDVNDGRE